MSVDQSKQIAQAFSWLRSLQPNCKLTESQVVIGDEVIKQQGLEAFATLIGYKLNPAVTGLFDISDAGYSIIRTFEGFKEQAYLDVGGVWTIGFGTIRYPNGVKVKKGDRCTMAQANEWLIQDCGWVDACLDRTISSNVKINQNQFDALASLVYNIGETNFSNSTLLRTLNHGDIKGATKHFESWIYVKGEKSQGLLNRRLKEKALFSKV